MLVLAVCAQSNPILANLHDLEAFCVVRARNPRLVSIFANLRTAIFGTVNTNLALILDITPIQSHFMSILHVQIPEDINK